jgi:hypothetical protein
MRLGAGIVIGACILAASAAMRPALPQSGDLVPFDAGYLEAAAFIDDSAQAVRQDAATERPPIFGMETEPVAGEIAAKRRAVEADIDREQQVLARCRAQEACPVVAQNLLDLVAEGAGRSGLARVGLINRAVDLAITPAGDEAQWGVADRRLALVRDTKMVGSIPKFVLDEEGTRRFVPSNRAGQGPGDGRSSPARFVRPA